jgi:hypothetical protein
MKCFRNWHYSIVCEISVGERDKRKTMFGFDLEFDFVGSLGGE